VESRLEEGVTAGRSDLYIVLFSTYTYCRHGIEQTLQLDRHSVHQTIEIRILIIIVTDTHLNEQLFRVLHYKVAPVPYSMTWPPGTNY